MSRRAMSHTGPVACSLSTNKHENILSREPKAKGTILKKKKKTKEGDPVNVQQHAVVVPVLATSIPEKNTTAQFQEEQGGTVIDDPSEINDRTISRNPYSASSEDTMARDSVMKSSLALVNPNNPPSVNNEGEIMKEATRGDDSATGGCNDILDATTVQKDLKREWELAPFREALERFIQSDEFFVIKHRPTLHPVDNFQHGVISKSSPKHKDSKHSILSLLHLPPFDTSIFVSSEKEQWPKDQQPTTAPPPGVVAGITHNTVEIQTVLSNNNWSSESSKENTEHPSLLNEQSLSLPPPTLVDTVKEDSDKVIDDNHHDYQRSQNNPPRTKSIWDDNDDKSTKCPTDESVDLNLTNTSNDEDVPSRQSDDDDEEEEEEEEDKYDEESFQSCHSKKSDLVIKPLNNATAVDRPISLPTMQLLDDTANATDDDLQPYPSIGTVDAIPVEVRDDNYVDVVHHQPQPFLQENKKGCSWVFDLKDDEAELVEDVRQQSYSESEDSESSSFISEVVV